MTRPGAPIFPPGRYGHRREGGRRRHWLPVALAVAGVLALILLMLRLYNQYGVNQYEAGPVRYGPTTDTRVTVTFEVRKPAAGTGTCRLQAKDSSGVETGYAEVEVGTGAQVTVNYTLTTKARAVLVDILGCRAAAR